MTPIVLSYGMRTLWGFAIALIVSGCSSPTAAKPADPTASTVETGQSGSTSASNADASAGGIQPMTTTPVPNAPVSGTESLQGGGSNVGAVAKDRAKQAASQVSTPNVGTETEGE